MCPLQIACSNTSFVWVLLHYNKQEGEWEERKRGDAELRRGMTIFRNHQKIRGALRGWRAGEAVSEREEGRERAGEKDGIGRQWQQGRKGRGGAVRDAGREVGRSARCVREDISHRASTSLSLGDLFYPPSACWTRDEKRLMNNRGEGEMDENEAAFLSSLLPPSQPLFLPLFCDPLFFFFNSRTKKDFINNLRDFFGRSADVGARSV